MKNFSYQKRVTLRSVELESSLRNEIAADPSRAMIYFMDCGFSQDAVRGNHMLKVWFDDALRKR